MRKFFSFGLLLVGLIFINGIAIAQPPPASPEAIRSVAWSPLGDRIAIGRQDGRIQILDADSGNIILDWQAEASMPVLEIDWNSSGDRLASGGFDRVLRIWDAENGSLIREITDYNEYITSVVWHPSDPHIVAGADISGLVEAWNVQTGDLIVTIISSYVHQIDWDSTGERMVVVHGAAAEVYSTADGQLIQRYGGQGGETIAVDWLPNSGLFASSGLGEHILIWDSNLSEGSLVDTLEGHTNAVTAVEFNPDGTVLASTSLDYTLRFWDVMSGDLIHTITESVPLYDVSWSPDGTRLVYVGNDGLLEIIDRPDAPSSRDVGQ